MLFLWQVALLSTSARRKMTNPIGSIDTDAERDEHLERMGHKIFDKLTVKTENGAELKEEEMIYLTSRFAELKGHTVSA